MDLAKFFGTFGTKARSKSSRIHEISEKHRGHDRDAHRTHFHSPTGLSLERQSPDVGGAREFLVGSEIVRYGQPTALCESLLPDKGRRKINKFEINAGRRWIYDIGELLIGKTPPLEPTIRAWTPPSGFPPNIVVDVISFEDWSTYIQVPDATVARVTSPSDVAAVCNWAAANSWTVRAIGKGNNWSPLLFARGTPSDLQVMLIDTTALNATSFSLTEAGIPLATLGTGLTMEEATAYLASLDNAKPGSAPGYAFPHVPAPGGLSIGGVFAIGGHGTLVPSGTSELNLMGGLSNLITGFDAVVTDPKGPTPTTYAVRHFDRSEIDSAAFLVHLGRAFITSVTVRVIPNYYLQLQCLFPPVAELFRAPQTGNEDDAATFAELLDTFGRIEVLWFPYRTNAFVQANKLEQSRIEPQVRGPYNYPWMNMISRWENSLIKAALFDDPSLTPRFTEFEFEMSKFNQENVTLNGTARDLEIYLKDTTLRVSLFGWALQIPRAHVQQVASIFYEKVNTLLTDAQGQGKYPINAAMEIRCTTVDHQGDLPDPASPPPTLAATHSVNPADPSVDTVIWLNVGTVTGTPGSNEFCTELETWMLATWGSTTPNPLRPEWSKAWAYTDQGPWTNVELMAKVRDMYNQGPDEPFTFDGAAATLARYDHAHLFTSPLLDKLFTT